VTSFDFDPQSVACTSELRQRYFPEDEGWVVQQGSVLDERLLDSLGTFDVVYSWGVLHHTGSMWRGIDLTQRSVKHGGLYFIALYNDQGMRSRVWWWLKRVFCSGAVGRLLVTMLCVPYFVFRRFVSDAIRGQNPLAHYREYHRSHRGMSIIRDWVDWLGGFPFEVATPTATFDFLRARGFRIDRLRTTLGSGCNEFLFRREAPYPSLDEGPVANPPRSALIA
jgi:2-polyprenyl-6-hydroxyphenyl methylase/3-demethylubiquinone-9 3-methyltransferase